MKIIGRNKFKRNVSIMLLLPDPYGPDSAMFLIRPEATAHSSALMCSSHPDASSIGAKSLYSTFVLLFFPKMLLPISIVCLTKQTTALKGMFFSFSLCFYFIFLYMLISQVHLMILLCLLLSFYKILS